MSSAGRTSFELGTVYLGNAMEMHQIRYFLAVSETLNLTKAAERCNVTQPSLTRAIKALEMQSWAAS